MQVQSCSSIAPLREQENPVNAQEFVACTPCWLALRRGVHCEPGPFIWLQVLFRCRPVDVEPPGELAAKLRRQSSSTELVAVESLVSETSRSLGSGLSIPSIANSYDCTSSRHARKSSSHPAS